MSELAVSLIFAAMSVALPDCSTKLAFAVVSSSRSTARPVSMLASTAAALPALSNPCPKRVRAEAAVPATSAPSRMSKTPFAVKTFLSAFSSARRIPLTAQAMNAPIDPPNVKVDDASAIAPAYRSSSSRPARMPLMTS
jgi:hypothetical protein